MEPVLFYNILLQKFSVLNIYDNGKVNYINASQNNESSCKKIYCFRYLPLLET